MASRDDYRKQLQRLQDWDTFLLEHSGLPGPRGNLELAQAVADEGSEQLFERYRRHSATRAPTGSREEFLAFCGVLGLGRLLSEGRMELLATLRGFASDPRWRIREGVAMALQRLGEANMSRLLDEMAVWSQGNLLERRSVAAGLCEPRLLVQPSSAKATLHILDRITASILEVEDRKSGDFEVLRKGLGYAWSVAVAALPEEGKRYMEEWFENPDKDIRWIMRENLKKNRLVRADARWVEKWSAKLKG